MSGTREIKLHEAICQAVAIMAMSFDIAKSAEGRQSRDILRQALIDYADTEPAPQAPTAAPAGHVGAAPELKPLSPQAEREMFDDYDRWVATQGHIWTRLQAFAAGRATRESAAPAPSRSKALRDAGFTPRDRRLTCDECGAKFTAQFAPLHECAAPLSDKSLASLVAPLVGVRAEPLGVAPAAPGSTPSGPSPQAVLVAGATPIPNAEDACGLRGG